MKILALELGEFKTTCCLSDTKKCKYAFLTAATERTFLFSVFMKHQIDPVVLEAGGPSG